MTLSCEVCGLRPMWMATPDDDARAVCSECADALAADMGVTPDRPEGSTVDPATGLAW